MRLAPSCLVFMLMLFILPIRAAGVVYLNMQWNEDTEEWDAMPLIIEGEGLSLNREYQNAYGYEMDLPPGPPFIITEGIIVRNEYDENDRVVHWGGLTVTTIGEGTDPFELQFFSPEGSTGPSYIVSTGHVSIEGTSSDPIIFTGAFGISNPQWPGVDPEENHPRLQLAYCVFDRVGYDGTCSMYLLNINSSDVTLKSCTFSNFLPNAVKQIVRFEEESMVDPPDWSFTMRECVFDNIMLDGAPPILLQYIGGEIKLESNVFTDVVFDDSSWDDGVLVNIRGFGGGRITGNTGSGNTNSAFWIRGWSTADGSMTFRSSSDLPFLVGQITVADRRTLTIEEGSVLKMNELMSEANFRVYGTMIAEGAIFTSWEDDSIGGDNDLQPEPPAVGYWGSTNEGGILISQDATLRLRNSTVRYARSGIDALGSAIIDGCTFELNEYSGFKCGGGIDGQYEVTNSAFEDNGGVGISFVNDGLFQTLTVDNVRSIGNSRGINIYGSYANPANVTVSRSIFAGNVKAAVLVTVGPGLQACVFTGCAVSGNFSAGIRTVDNDGDDALLRFESCVIAGNGYDFFSGEGTYGAYIEGGRPYVINNTVAWNKGNGYSHVPPYPYGGDEDVANNIFMGNRGYGYANYVELPSRFSHNCFRENEDGELRIDADEGDFGSVGELAVLGGEYATNIATDPELVAGVEGVVDSVRYLAVSNRSYLFSGDADNAGRNLGGLIVRPDIHEDPWFFITRHSGDTLVVVGDITGIAAPGDTFNIFDHHLDWDSGIVDAGNSALPVGPLDIDGDHRVIDGDGDIIPDVDIGADEYGADSMTLVLLSPEPDDYWISGEERNITWSAVGIDTIGLYYQAPHHPDSNYTVIEMKLPASGGTFKWTVPDSLSTRCRVMIESDANPNHVVESGFFTIRSPRLARIGPGGEYEAYHPDVDGWRFGNVGANMWPEAWWSQFDYLNGIDPHTGESYPAEWSDFGLIHAQPDDFPDWLLWVDAFGVDQCYIDTPDGPVYSPSAVWNWSRIKGQWNGSCFGFAQSSFQAFDDKITFLVSFPDVDNFDSLYALQQMGNFRHRKTINMIMNRQHSREFWDYVIANYTKSAIETLDEIREMLLDETRDDRALAIYNNNGAGGHAVNPYRIMRDDVDPAVEWIYVYDSNVPGDCTARIRLNTETGVWDYSNLPTWGGTHKLFLVDPASDYLSHVTLCDPAPIARQSRRVFAQGGTHHEYYVTPGVTTIIMDNSGHSVGFADSILLNTMPDAVPMIPLAAEYTPPIGYVVPAGDYTAEITGFPDTLVTFGVARDSMMFSYVRSDASPVQADRIVCGDGFTIYSYDGADKVMHAQAITIGVDEERVFDLENIVLSQDDSIRLETPDGEEFIAANLGEAKEYGLRVRRVSGAGMVIFEHDPVTLPAGTGHRIVPDWEGLEAVPVKIYIDTGNDGSIDDSIFVENEYVATLLQHFSAVFKESCIVIDWRLSQIDDGIEFDVLRADADGGEFRILSEPIVKKSDLSFIVRDYSIRFGEQYRYRITYATDGESRILFETKEISTPAMPLRLYQNYPNPFNPTTKIRYYLPVSARVRLTICDVAGRKVATLVDRAKKAGCHEVIWDGRNDSGRRIDSGVYFIRLRAGKRTISKKMVILK